MTEQYNAAVAEKRAAEAELSAVDLPVQVSAADIRKMVQELGDMTPALDQAMPMTWRRSTKRLDYN